jgi:hypothetical protein
MVGDTHDDHFRTISMPIVADLVSASSCAKRSAAETSAQDSLQNAQFGCMVMKSKPISFHCCQPVAW